MNQIFVFPEYSYSYSAAGGTRTRTRCIVFEYEYEYHFIEYEYEMQSEKRNCQGFELALRSTAWQRWLRAAVHRLAAVATDLHPNALGIT